MTSGVGLRHLRFELKPTSWDSCEDNIRLFHRKGGVKVTWIPPLNLWGGPPFPKYLGHLVEFLFPSRDLLMLQFFQHFLQFIQLEEVKTLQTSF